MRRIFLVIMVLLLFTSVVFAEETTGIDTDAVEEGIPDDALEIMPEISADGSADLWESVKETFFNALGKSGESLKSALRLCAILLTLVLLCSVAQLPPTKNAVNAISVAGSLGICAVFIGTANTMVTLATNTLQSVSDYSAFMLPVLASASAMSGGITSSSALYAGTVMFSELLMQLVSKLLIPALYFFLAICAAEAALASELLTEIREFIGWLISKSLRIIVYIFLGFLSITGVIGGAADAAAIRATKATLSGMVPVVGGIISDASETLLASASILKSSIGIFGLIVILAICLVPFFQIGIQYLMLKVTSAISGTIGLKPHVKLLKNFSSAMGYLLAMCGTCCFLLMISCVCFIKVVG